MKNEERRALQTTLTQLVAYDNEDAAPRHVFPIAEHLRALEPEVVLVVGDRGSGKSRLRSALLEPEFREALHRHAPTVRVPQGELEWRTGWPLGKDGPDSPGWDTVLRAEPRGIASQLWHAYLLRALHEDLGFHDQERVSSLHAARGADPAEVLRSFCALGIEATALLDALDTGLEREGRWIFVSYDELDTIAESWDTMGTLIGGLVSFWASYARRWRRIRPKIFLRTDFYTHHRDVAGADVVKIAGNRVELAWSDRQLYGALLQYVLNADDSTGERPLRKHFAKVVAWTSDPLLGDVPTLANAEAARPFVERLVGEFMGANSHKGYAFRWMLDHVRDGNRRVVPRSLALLVGKAAARELNSPRAEGAQLLHPISLRNALDEVSVEHVLQATTHEFAWLDGLKRRLASDRHAPWPRRELLRLLRVDFDKAWSNSGPRPPGNDPDEVLASLVELGILRVRSSGTAAVYDVPDLYLHGLELVRRGGVARG